MASRQSWWIVAVAGLAVMLAAAAGLGYLHFSSVGGPCTHPPGTGTTVWTAPRSCHTVVVPAGTHFPNVVVFVGQTLQVDPGDAPASASFSAPPQDHALRGGGRTYVAQAPGVDQIEAPGPVVDHHGYAYFVGVNVQVSGVSLTSPTFTSPLVGWSLDAGHLANNAGLANYGELPASVERSSDGGRTWHSVTPPGSSFFHYNDPVTPAGAALTPVSDNVAWTFWDIPGSYPGSARVGVTSDGGTSWTEHPLPDNLGEVRSAYASDALHAMAVFESGRFPNGPMGPKGSPLSTAPALAMTSDGGVTWTAAPLWGWGTGPWAARGSSVLLTLSTSSEQVVARTTNNGQTWTSAAAPGQTFPDCPTSALVLPTPTHGYLVTACPSPTLWSTADGGVTWSSPGPLDWPPLGPPGFRATLPPPTNLVFTDAERGWTFRWPGGASGVADLMSTPDGGRSWQPSSLWLSLPDGAWISFPTAQHGFVWVPSEGRFYETADGGATWTHQPAPTSR